jgi:hypothetical protein
VPPIRISIAAATLALSTLTSSQVLAATTPPPLVLYNTTIYTANDAQPRAEAVISDKGRITFLGSTADALKHAPANCENAQASQNRSSGKTRRRIDHVAVSHPNAICFSSTQIPCTCTLDRNGRMTRGISPAARFRASAITSSERASARLFATRSNTHHLPRRSCREERSSTPAAYASRPRNRSRRAPAATDCHPRASASRSSRSVAGISIDAQASRCDGLLALPHHSAKLRKSRGSTGARK